MVGTAVVVEQGQVSFVAAVVGVVWHELLLEVVVEVQVLLSLSRPLPPPPLDLFYWGRMGFRFGTHTPVSVHQGQHNRTFLERRNQLRLFPLES